MAVESDCNSGPERPQVSIHLLSDPQEINRIPADDSAADGAAQTRFKLKQFDGSTMSDLNKIIEEDPTADLCNASESVNTR